MDVMVSAYIAISLDGFIARANGDLDWLPNVAPEGEDYGFQEFYTSIDTIVMGRHTFEKVLTFGEWPYTGKRVIVLSSSQHKVEKPPEGIEFSTLELPELMEHLGQSGSKHLYVDGGKTIQSFLFAGLIDEITITTIPVLIGNGVPLFGPLESDLELEHIQTHTFENGLVQTKYRVLGS